MNGKYKNKEEEVIDLSVLFGVLFKNLPLLIVITILGAALAFSYTKYLIPNKYQATATVIVNNKTSDAQYVNQGDITTSQGLAELYSIIIKSNTVVDQVVADFKGTEYEEQSTKEFLKNSIIVGTVSDSQVVEISMVNADPEYAKQVVDKFVKYSKPVIKEKVDVRSVEDLDEASLTNDGRPVSPSKTKNTIVGAVAGFVIAAAVVILKEMFNTTLKTETDVTNVLGVPLLGVIPMIDRKEFRGK